MRPAVWLACLLLALPGCAGWARRSKPRDPPEPADFRVQLALDVPREGYQPRTDRSGQKLYVAPDVEFDNRDLFEVRALHSQRRSMLQFNLRGFAAQRLAERTRDLLRERAALTQREQALARQELRPPHEISHAYLAVFIDRELIGAARLDEPITDGEIRVVGDWSRSEAAKLVERLRPAGEP